MVKYRSGKVRGVMAIGAILIAGIGRYMVLQLTHADPVVMARIAAIIDTGMIIGAGAESPRGMTGTAILSGRHVGIERGAKRHATCRTRPISNMTGDATITHDATVIDAKCWSETFGIVARSTICTGGWVGGHRGRLGGRVNTGAIVVARITRLHRGINQAVIE